MPTSTQQQTQQHTQSQAEHALQQYASAHGLPHIIPWGTILPILIQLVQALAQGGGGVQPQASPPNQP